MICKAVGILMVGGCAALNAPAWAHHSNVAYDSSKRITLEGTVTSVKWVNPHMAVEIAVPTADGKTETWTVEMGGLTASVAAGLSRKNLNVGTKVKMYASPNRDPATLRANSSGIEIDGKFYGRNADDTALLPDR